MEVPRFKWKAVYVYYILIACTLLSLVASQELMEIPTWGTLFGILFLLYAATDQSWKAFKKQGKASILTSLKPDDGGHSTIHPDDISFAMSKGETKKGGKKLPSFVVFVTGGFVHGGIEWQGQENYVVCPPEHVENTGSAFICHTRLKRVRFDELPSYVQDELLKLKYFDIISISAKRNLWFGMTSKIDGTADSNYLEKESKFVDQTYLINQLKTLLKDKPEVYSPVTPGKKNKEQIVINIPNRE